MSIPYVSKRPQRTMKSKITIKQLVALKPCKEGKAYLARHKSIKAAWENCAEPAWMFWALARVAPLTKEQSVRLSVRFAGRTLSLFTATHPNDTRPAKAIEAAEAWLANPTATKAAASAAEAAKTAAKTAAKAAARFAAEAVEAAEAVTEPAAWSSAKATVEAAIKATVEAEAAAAATAATYAAASAAAETAAGAAACARGAATEAAAAWAWFPQFAAESAEKSKQCEIIREMIKL